MVVPRLERRLGLLPGRGACGHPDGATRLVRGPLGTFAADFREHAYGRPCAGSGNPWLWFSAVGDPTPAGRR